jgi:hypothetical protein
LLTINGVGAIANICPGGHGVVSAHARMKMINFLDGLHIASTMVIHETIGPSGPNWTKNHVSWAMDLVEALFGSIDTIPTTDAEVHTQPVRARM